MQDSQRLHCDTMDQHRSPCSLSAPAYIPLNLQPEMTAGPPQTKKAKVPSDLRLTGNNLAPQVSGDQTHPSW